jgi:hypothetical protein
MTEDENHFSEDETPSELDSTGAARPPPCEHGVESQLDDNGRWTDPTLHCPECVELLSAAAEVPEEELPVKVVEGSVTVVKEKEVAHIDVSDVEPSEVGRAELVIGAGHISTSDSLNIDLADEDRLARMAGLSVLELIRRVYTERAAKAHVLDALPLISSIIAAHSFHIANQKYRALEFETGEPLWTNPSYIVIGASGSGKRAHLMAFQELTHGTYLSEFAGRTTIPGFIGTTQTLTYKEHGEVESYMEPVPGLMENLKDGFVLVDEFHPILSLEEQQAGSLALLMEVLWSGRAPVNLAKGHRIVETWTALAGGLQTTLWDANFANTIGVFRRFVVFSIPEPTPEENASRLVQRNDRATYDKLAMSVIRAKLAYLIDWLDGMGSIANFTGHLGAIRQWVAKRIQEQRIAPDEDAIFIALAIGYNLITMKPGTKLATPLWFTMTPELEKMLNAQIEARPPLLQVRAEEQKHVIAGMLERPTLLGTGAFRDLREVIPIISQELRMDPTEVQSALMRLLGLDLRYTPPTDEPLPLVREHRDLAQTWNEEKNTGAALPEDTAAQVVFAIGLHSVLDTLNFKAWKEEKESLAGKLTRAARSRPWDKSEEEAS